MQFTLKFLKEPPLYNTVQPYNLHGFFDLGEAQQTNCVYETVDEVTAQDIRLIEESPQLGREGFEAISAPTRCTISAEVFENDSAGMNEILADFLQETMDLVKSKFNADSIVTIDWRVGDASLE